MALGKMFNLIYFINSIVLVFLCVCVCIFGANFGKKGNSLFQVVNFFQVPNDQGR